MSFEKVNALFTKFITENIDSFTGDSIDEKSFDDSIDNLEQYIFDTWKDYKDELRNILKEKPGKKHKKKTLSRKSGYNLFTSDQMPLCKKELPDAKNSDYFTLIGNRWFELKEKNPEIETEYNTRSSENNESLKLISDDDSSSEFSYESTDESDTGYGDEYDCDYYLGDEDGGLSMMCESYLNSIPGYKYFEKNNRDKPKHQINCLWNSVSEKNLKLYQSAYLQKHPNKYIKFYRRYFMEQKLILPHMLLHKKKYQDHLNNIFES